MTEDPLRVAIIGGGAIGTGTLFHLVTEYDHIEPILFEKDQLGAGSTSKAAGGVRNTFTSLENLRMGKRNIAFFENFAEHVGQELEFRQTGYMYLFHSDASADEWRDRAEFFSEHGVTAEIRSPAETAAEFPPLNADNISGSLFASDCGHVDPHTVTQAFGTAAIDHGATIHTDTAVTDIHIENGAVTALDSDVGRIEVDAVLNAAGPWAPRVGEMVGLDIPIDLFVRRIMVTSPIEHANSPLIIDPEWQCYFAAEKNGSMLACNMEEDIHSIDDPDAAIGDEVGYDYYLRTTEKIRPLVPAIDDLEIINGWAGFQSHTADGNAIIGSTEIEGFYLACGFSGHGVQQAPSVGAAMADLIATGATDVFDLAPFAPDRFDEEGSIDTEQMA